MIRMVACFLLLTPHLSPLTSHLSPLTFAQTAVREEIGQKVDCAAGLNRAYDPADSTALTPTPEGKAPFAIISCNRHGACYLGKPGDYDAPYMVLAGADSIGGLTTLGKSVLDRLSRIRQDARSHWGELSDVGVGQQQEIARRMAERFPEIFNKDAWHIGARSLRNTRSLLSMEQLMTQISRVYRIRVYHNASQEYSDYLDSQDEGHLRMKKDSLAQATFEAFSNKYCDGDRLAKTLFADSDYISGHVDVQRLSDQLFRIAGSIQNTRLKGEVSLYDLFTEDEIWHQWKRQNAKNYLNYGHAVRQSRTPLIRQLLRRLLHDADTALTMKPTAVFLFVDETTLAPLVCLMDINGYGLVTDDLEALDNQGWADYRICPMGANMQWVLYRRNREDGDVLIKVLLNGQEASLPLSSENAPYYRLKDFKDYYLNILDSYE